MIGRLRDGNHSRREDGERVVYKAGDLVELSEAEVRSFGDRFDLIDEESESLLQPGDDADDSDDDGDNDESEENDEESDDEESEEDSTPVEAPKRKRRRGR